MAMVGLRIWEMSRCSLVKPWKKRSRAASGPSEMPRFPIKFSPLRESGVSRLMSAPEQNPRPTPVRTMTRTLGSSSPALMYSPTLATVPFSSDDPIRAFIRSGLLNFIHRMPLSSGS